MDEFQAVGKNIFDVLYFKIRAKNIAMEDIGMRSYKNWGIRDNFGAVLLDYPTMYVADKRNVSVQPEIDSEIIVIIH